MHCMRRGFHPPTPPSQGGESRRRPVFFPPFARGDTGGFFECPCVAPGSAFRRLKITLKPGFSPREEIDCGIVPIRSMARSLTRLLLKVDLTVALHVVDPG